MKMVVPYSSPFAAIRALPMSALLSMVTLLACTLRALMSVDGMFGVPGEAEAKPLMARIVMSSLMLLSLLLISIMQSDEHIILASSREKMNSFSTSFC